MSPNIKVADDDDDNIKTRPNLDDKDRPKFHTEDVINELGNFGKYQLFHYALIAVPVVMGSILNANFIFLARDPDYRCRIPECERGSTFKSLKPPWTDSSSKFDFKCKRPTIMISKSDEGGCLFNLTAENNSIACTEWIHEEYNSLISKLNLECSPVKRNLIGTVHFSGTVLCLLIMGYISDKYGRKRAFIITTVGGGLVGLSKVFVNNYYAYITLEFLEALIGTAVFEIGFFIMVEMTGTKYRFIIPSINGIAISIGEILLGFAASMVNDYKILIVIVYSPPLICLSYILLLDESIRWLITSGKTEKAKEVICKAASWNQIELSEKLHDQLNNLDSITLYDNCEGYGNKINFKEIVKSKFIVIRVLISMFWWISSDFIYYGLLMNSLKLPGNIYQNFMMTGSVGIIGECFSLLSLNRFGRKMTLLYCYMICAVCIIGKSCIPEESTWAVISLFLIGKVFITAAFSSIYIYTSELFPTQVRSILVGFTSMFAGVGSIFAPLTILLADFMPQLPSAIFGLMSLLAGTLAIFTPETLNKRLPDTVKDAEAMSR